MRRLWLALVILLALLLLAALVIRPPGPGQVLAVARHIEGPQEAALLLRSGPCLLLSLSERDIGRTEVEPSGPLAADRFWIIAGPDIRSGSDGRGLYLRDRRSGLIVRAGEGLAGGLFRHPASQGTKGALVNLVWVGWPRVPDCARRPATLYSIDRVIPVGPPKA